jgi:3-oxoadipate enol-lactonase
MHIKANGISFNYQIDGAQDAPGLIFSNSLATNLSMWDEQGRALSGRFRVLRYDQRGHGKTEVPEGRYPFAILLADAVALMDALEIRRAHFCGLSLGGATALGLAERYPDRIDRAIACDSPCASTPTSTKQWEERIVTAKGGGIAAIAEPTLQRVALGIERIIVRFKLLVETH